MAALWYAVFSKPRKEAQVENYLRSSGIETFYPTLRVTPVNPRASRIRPFFPRYLFIHADLDQVGVSVLDFVPGAVGLVQFGGEPSVVPDAFIHELRRRLNRIEQAGGLNLDGLKRGDKVKITQGPFAGYEAVFDERLSGEDRVQVLLRWLGREMKLKVKNSAVEKRRVR